MKKGIFNKTTTTYDFSVVAVNIHQTIHVDPELEIKAYYAGHVQINNNYVFFYIFGGFGSCHVLCQSRRRIGDIYRRL